SVLEATNNGDSGSWRHSSSSGRHRLCGSGPHGSRYVLGWGLGCAYLWQPPQPISPVLAGRCIKAPVLAVGPLVSESGRDADDETDDRDGVGVGDESAKVCLGDLAALGLRCICIAVLRVQGPYLSIEFFAIERFLLHSGWNSTLESLVNGVPMIEWPLYAEQDMNATMLAHKIGLAVRPEARSSSEVIGRAEIQTMNKGSQARGRQGQDEVEEGQGAEKQHGEGNRRGRHDKFQELKTLQEEVPRNYWGLFS
ncbi:Anthocyanidin 3-O-glucosyltransferase 5-like protein, partial [Drosera capensis]